MMKNGTAPLQLLPATIPTKLMEITKRTQTAASLRAASDITNALVARC